MDWAAAIAINHSALNRIVAALIAMVGLAAEEARTRLPRPAYRAALRILRPAESALRRLIVIAARDVVVTARVTRPMPAGLVLPARRGARVSFRLFDPRKRFVMSAAQRRAAHPRFRREPLRAAVSEAGQWRCESRGRR